MTIMIRCCQSIRHSRPCMSHLEKVFIQIYEIVIGHAGDEVYYDFVWILTEIIVDEFLFTKIIAIPVCIFYVVDMVFIQYGISAFALSLPQ